MKQHLSLEAIYFQESLLTSPREGHYEQTVGDGRERLAQFGLELSDEDLQETSYYLALALEALDRPDEALAEYVAIYEAAPESPWGMLAALHFAVVDESA